MFLSEVLGTPVSVNVDGETIEFPRLRMSDYARLEGEMRGHRHAVNRELLDECQITGNERYVHLRDAEGQPVTLAHMRAYLQLAAGSKSALTMSLKRAGKTDREAADTIEKLDMLSAHQIASVVVGFAEVVAEGTANPLAQSGTGEQKSDSSEPSAPAKTPQA